MATTYQKGYFEITWSSVSLTQHIPFTLKIYQLQRDKIKDLVNDKYVREINITAPTPTITVTIKYQDTTLSDTVLTISANDFNTTMITYFGTTISAVGGIDAYSFNGTLEPVFVTWFDLTKNAIFLYRNNSSKDTVSKSLIWVASDEVKYTRPIQYKQLVLDVKRSATDSQYNYVYLTVLNRYYYVTDAILTNDYASLTLREDVLMSFSDLIRLQDAFVTRNEFTYDKDLVDNRRTFKNESEFTYIEVTNNVFDITTGGTTIGGVDRDLRFVLTVVGYGL